MKHLLTLLLLFFGNSFCNHYYAQEGQDQFVYEQFFKTKIDGIFIDIGAYDGISLSNTYFFEKELGWSGICFEPLPHLFKRLTENRNCVCVNACVSSTEGTVSFIHVDTSCEMLSGMQSTFDQRMMDIVNYNLANYGGQTKIIDLPSIRLSTVLDQYGITNIDYLSIDTEGSEFEIVKTIDFEKYYIHVLSVENNYEESDLRDYIKSKGFALVARVCKDDIYVNLADK